VPPERAIVLKRVLTQDRELEQIRPVVVPGGIEALARVAKAVGLELGVEDPLLVVQRPGEVAPVRREDRGAATAVVEREFPRGEY